MSECVRACVPACVRARTCVCAEWEEDEEEWEERKWWLLFTLRRRWPAQVKVSLLKAFALQDSDEINSHLLSVIYEVLVRFHLLSHPL